MMKRTQSMKKEAAYTVDLTKIDGDGAFSCPKCGTVISPDDASDETYQVVNTRVEKDQLAELILTCKKCGSAIRLTGFLSLSET